MTRLLRAAAALVALTVAMPAMAQQAATGFSLRDINNQEVSLEAQKGKVVLLSFWATWCGPCKVEMPHLNKLFEEKKDEGFVVLSISSDDARTKSQVKPYIMRQRYSFPVLLDTEGKVTSIYNPTKTLPYTAIVDRQGNIAYVHSGYTPGDEVEIKHKVEELLAKQ